VKLKGRNAVFEVIPGTNRGVFYFGSVIVNGVDRIPQKCGNSSGIFYAESYQRKDPQFCVEQITFF